MQAYYLIFWHLNLQLLTGSQWPHEPRVTNAPGHRRGSDAVSTFHWPSEDDRNL